MAPHSIERWVARARWLRWLDVVATGLAVWPVLALTLDVTAGASAIATVMLVAGAALVRPLRLRWRPVSALVALSVSRRLRPGDRAWCVLPSRADLVIVTARRGLRLVLARPGQESTEGLEVRRTRVLVVP